MNRANNRKKGPGVTRGRKEVKQSAIGKE
jgi:hypothetical protein